MPPSAEVESLLRPTRPRLLRVSHPLRLTPVVHGSQVFSKGLSTRRRESRNHSPSVTCTIDSDGSGRSSTSGVSSVKGGRECNLNVRDRHVNPCTMYGWPDYPEVLERPVCTSDYETPSTDTGSCFRRQTIKGTTGLLERETTHLRGPSGGAGTTP